MGRPRGAIWHEFVDADNDNDTGKERVKCKHCERVVSKRVHRLQQHLVGCRAFARAVELKLTSDEALQQITRQTMTQSALLAHTSMMAGLPLEPPPGLHIGGTEGSAGRRHLEPTSAGRHLEAQQAYETIKDYYGMRLQRASDVVLSGRGVNAGLHPHAEQILSKVPDEVLSRYLGVGNPLPMGIEGMRVLDLGCGTGRDAYIAAALVGVRGYVLGVDVTPQQVEVAERNVEEFVVALGYRQANLRFIEGQMEYLDKAGIAARSMDLVISNSALNLSPNKELALKEVMRVLRPGGEFYFSDVFVTRRLPESVRKHDILLSECIGGALYIEDFKRICRQVGFGEPREVARTPVEIRNPGFADMVGVAKFFSITYRCFKVPHMESGVFEEDYGHVATYLGTIPGLPHGYQLDSGLFFESLRPMRIGGNTAAVLKHSWLKKYFNVHGDWSVHFGRFDDRTAASVPFATSSAPFVGGPMDHMLRGGTGSSGNNGHLLHHDGPQHHGVELNGDNAIF